MHKYYRVDHVCICDVCICECLSVDKKAAQSHTKHELAASNFPFQYDVKSCWLLLSRERLICVPQTPSARAISASNATQNKPNNKHVNNIYVYTRHICEHNQPTTSSTRTHSLGRHSHTRTQCNQLQSHLVYLYIYVYM